jgi:NitT/TauT family transport system permease protein
MKIAEISVERCASRGAPDAEEQMFIAVTEQKLEKLRARREHLTLFGCQVLLVGVLLVLWQVAPATGAFDPFYISRPSLILETLWTWATTGMLWRNMLITLTITLAGFLIGGVLGFICGALLGINKWLGRMLTPFVTALQSVPRLALVPLFILWFGIGALSKLALVATVVFFPVFMATRAGVAAVDEQLTNTLRIMRAKPWQVHMKATLPSAMIWITEGLRISIPWALVATVTAEILSSNEGLGYLLARSAGQFFTAGVFAAILVLTILGVVLTYLVTLMERRLLAWKRVTQH